MKILYVASEVAPFIKTGGLADVASAFPKTLAKQGHDIRVVLPLYKTISNEFKDKMKLIKSFDVNLAWRNQSCDVFELVADGVIYYFLDNKYYFGRSNLYGHFDDAERFAYFSKAVLDMIKEIDFCPDVINANDWQASLIPTYMKLVYNQIDFYKDIKTVITIHNIQYQGAFSKDIIEDVLGLNQFFFNNGYLEHKGAVNFLKASILSADAVTTVSKTYSNEIKTPYYAHGLQDVLKENEYKLYGVLNGLDIDLYNPKENVHLFHKFDVNSLEEKKKNKKELLRLLSLQSKEDVPIIGIVSRFVSHKGFDLIENVLDDILSEDIKLVVLGTGDFKYEKMFEVAKYRYPGKISVNIAFSEDLANKIYAGSDMFLMPSKSEPCGLAQMISMRYGTLPIVRETGGLLDTVETYQEKLDTGDGFTFKNINAHDMLYVIKEACGVYRNKKDEWNKIIARAMQKDFSWDKSANEYIDIYEKITTVPEIVEDEEICDELENIKNSKKTTK